MGLYFAVDVYRPVREIRDSNRLLAISRRATLIFGAIATLAAAYFSMYPVPLISLLGSIAWGGMASTLFVPLFFGLFWRRATREGAMASAIGGLLFAIGAFVARRLEVLPFHEIYPGIVASFLLMILVSLRTPASNSSTLDRFFPG